MRIPTFFKELLTREIPMDAAERADLAADIQKEYDTIQYSEAYIKSLKDEGKPIPMAAVVKKWGENVYIRVCLAIVYLVALNWIRDLKNPRPEHGDEDKDMSF